MIALSLSPFFRSVRQSNTVLLMGAGLSITPDLDVIGLRLGIPYEHMLGHRGITHSLLFAIICSGFASWFLARSSKTYVLQVGIYLFLCMASHAVLDAFTNGGQGIAFFAPFNNERYFFPFTPIEVSTLYFSKVKVSL